MKTVSVIGSFGYAPAEGAQDARFSVAFSIPFTQKAEDELVFTAPVASRAIDLGTMTAPKAIYIEALEGSFSLKLNAGDTGTLGLGLSASPQTGEKSFNLWVNPTGASVSLYVSVAVAAKIKVLIFQ